MKTICLLFMMLFSTCLTAQITIDSIYVSDTVLCENNTGTAIVQVSPPGNYSYSWTFNGIPIGSNNDTIFYFYDTTGYFPLAVEVSDGIGNSAWDYVSIFTRANTNFNISASSIYLNCGDTVNLDVLFPSQSVFCSNYTNATGANSTTIFPSPFSNWYANVKQQYLFHASELNSMGLSAGAITSLNFEVTQINGLTVYPNYQIYLGHSSLTSLNTVFVNGLTGCYGPLNTSVQSGINTLNFSTPFYWDGVQNLIVEICYVWTAQYNYTSNSITPWTTTPFNSSMWYNSDGTPACIQNNAFTASTNRPVINFCQSISNPVSPSPMTFNWSSTEALSSSTTQNINAYPDSPAWYFVTCIDSLCFATDSIFIDYNNQINYYNLDIDGGICYTDTLLFSVNTSADQILWTFEDADIDSSNLFSQSVVFNNPGYHTFTYELSNVCGDTIIKIDSLNIQNPNYGFSANIQDDTLCVGILTFGSANINSYYDDYIWTFYNQGNPIIDTTSFFTFTGQYPGYDSVYVQSSHNYCNATSDTMFYIFMDNCNSIQEYDLSSIKLTYHNDQLIIYSLNSIITNCILYDINGKIIFINPNESDKIYIPLTDLSNGIYLIKIASGSKTEVIKFYIE